MQAYRLRIMSAGGRIDRIGNPVWYENGCECHGRGWGYAVSDASRNGGIELLPATNATRRAEYT